MLHKQIEHVLEKDKHIFLKVLNTIPKTMWHNRCAHSVWTVEETMSHIASNLELIPQVIRDIRRGKGFMNIPPFLTNLLRFLFVRNTLHIVSKHEVKQRYERAHLHALHVLETIHTNEWQKGEKFFGTYMTIQGIFTIYHENFHKHIRFVTDTMHPTLQ